MPQAGWSPFWLYIKITRGFIKYGCPGTSHSQLHSSWFFWVWVILRNRDFLRDYRWPYHTARVRTTRRDDKLQGCKMSFGLSSPLPRTLLPPYSPMCVRDVQVKCSSVTSSDRKAMRTLKLPSLPITVAFPLSCYLTTCVYELSYYFIASSTPEKGPYSLLVTAFRKVPCT